MKKKRRGIEKLHNYDSKRNDAILRSFLEEEQGLTPLPSTKKGRKKWEGKVPYYFKKLDAIFGIKGDYQ